MRGPNGVVSGCRHEALSWAYSLGSSNPDAAEQPLSNSLAGSSTPAAKAAAYKTALFKTKIIKTQGHLHFGVRAKMFLIDVHARRSLARRVASSPLLY